MFCNNLTSYTRRQTAVVEIGNVPLGGDFAVRIQSMTNTPTLDTESTVEQAVRMIEAGAEYVRITAPTLKDAENLETIHQNLRKLNFPTPLIADIHFSPKAAEIAAKFVEKVRINPGNYSEMKRSGNAEYTETEYTDDILRIKEKFIPLLKICKKNKTAIRIGTNHGSLSERIMSRYGDTPLGMVEATLEFLRMCVEENFPNVVISMKAGNPQVMIQACRLLVEKMSAENMNFPLHLGVTEAGDGEDGRVKSAIGIGSLLADGIGDTIRVSLTEEPEAELPVAKILTEIFRPEKLSLYQSSGKSRNDSSYFLNFQRRHSFAINNIGGNHVPIVILNAPNFFENNISEHFPAEAKADYLFNNNEQFIFDYTIDKTDSNIVQGQQYPVLSLDEYLSDRQLNSIKFVKISEKEAFTGDIFRIKDDNNALILAEIDTEHSSIHDSRSFFFRLAELQIDNPVILHYKINTYSEHVLIQTAAETGAVLIDGFGDGIWIDSVNSKSYKDLQSLSFSILQGCRARISKTEYISCPSCGRTLFDLQSVTAQIKSKTNHLKNLKIGIMGCIVNGPGEMADADYGYVGTGKGKITLYKKKEIVKKNIPENSAVEELINLIKSNGDWHEAGKQD